MHPVKTSTKRPEDLQWIYEGGIPGTQKPHPSHDDVEGNGEAGSNTISGMSVEDSVINTGLQKSGGDEDYVLGSKPDVVVVVGAGEV